MVALGARPLPRRSERAPTPLFAIATPDWLVEEKPLAPARASSRRHGVAVVAVLG